MVFMGNLKYLAKKKARPETNLRTIIQAKYDNFLDVYSKKHLDTFYFY